MTPADLKTMRESLGLTAQWLANKISVRLRTVQYWESGRSPVPDDVAMMVMSINKSFEDAVEQAIEVIKEQAEKIGGYPDLISFVRYRNDEDLWRFREDMRPLTTTAHASLISRVVREIDKMGIKSRIVYMDVAPYLEWLGGREDSEATRAEWANDQGAD